MSASSNPATNSDERVQDVGRALLAWLAGCLLFFLCKTSTPPWPVFTSILDNHASDIVLVAFTETNLHIAIAKPAYKHCCLPVSARSSLGRDYPCPRPSAISRPQSHPHIRCLLLTDTQEGNVTITASDEARKFLACDLMLLMYNFLIDEGTI